MDEDVVPDDGWKMYATLAGPGRVRTFAVCARGQIAESLSDTEQGRFLSPQTFVRARCAGHQVVGGGAASTASPYDFAVVGSTNADSTDPDRVRDDRWYVLADSLGASQPFSAYATCFAPTR